MRFVESMRSRHLMQMESNSTRLPSRDKLLHLLYPHCLVCLPLPLLNNFMGLLKDGEQEPTIDHNDWHCGIRLCLNTSHLLLFATARPSGKKPLICVHRRRRLFPGCGEKTAFENCNNRNLEICMQRWFSMEPSNTTANPL